MTSRPAPSGISLRILSILLLALTVLAGPRGALAQDDAGPYLLQPGDTVSVTVLEDPLLDRQVLVAPDGRISLPLAGSIIAAGRTPAQLAGVVRGRLRSRFVDPPTVTASLLAVGAVGEETLRNEVYVLGEVTRPGRYEYDPEAPITVLEALTLAGGPSPFAATARIQIRERAEEGERLRLFDYEAVEDGAAAAVPDLSELADGAVIIVPERGLFE